MAELQALNALTRYFTGLFSDLMNLPLNIGGQSLFGVQADESQTVFHADNETFDYDIMRYSNDISQLVPREKVTGSLIDRSDLLNQKYTNVVRSFPLAEDGGVIKSSQLTKRVSGEPPYSVNQGSGWTRQRRLRTLAAELFLYGIKRFVNLQELLAWESLIYGQMSSVLGTTNLNLIYDFRRNPNNNITVGTAWNDTSPDILGDIDGLSDQIYDASGRMMDMLVLSPIEFKSFINDSEVRALLDIRRLNQGFVTENMREIMADMPPYFSRFIAAGLKPRAFLITPQGNEVYVFTYRNKYKDAAGSIQNYIPDGIGMGCYSRARRDRHFGPPELLPETSLDSQWMREMFGFEPMEMMAELGVPSQVSDVVSAMMYHFIAYPENKSLIRILLHMGPLYITTETDAHGTLRGLRI